MSDSLMLIAKNIEIKHITINKEQHIIILSLNALLILVKSKLFLSKWANVKVFNILRNKN